MNDSIKYVYAMKLVAKIVRAACWTRHLPTLEPV